MTDIDSNDDDDDRPLLVKGADMATPGASKAQPASSYGAFAKLSASVSLFALLLMFRPSGGVLVDFIVLQEWASNAALTNDVFPWFSYAFAVTSLLFALASTSSGFKLQVIVGAFANLAATVIWVFFGYNAILLVFTQLLFGVFFSALSMFQALLLAATPRDRHAAITSFVRCAYLVGSVSGALLGQLLTSELSDRLQAYRTLFYLTIGTAGAAFVASFLLPNEPPPPRPPAPAKPLSGVWRELRRSALLLWHAARDATLCKFVVWNALWLAVHMLVLVHYQSLFAEFTGAPVTNLVLGIAYGGAALATLLQSVAPVQRALVYAADVWLMLGGAAAAACLYGMYSQTSNATALYACFVVYHCCYEFLQPFLIVQMARRLKRAQFGVVLGMASALAILCQVLLQLLLQFVPWFRTAVQNKFLLFMGVCAALALLPIVTRLLSCCCQQRANAIPKR